MSNTLIGGNIPSEIGNLVGLTHLDLSGSRFRQEIPGSAIGNLRALSKYQSNVMTMMSQFMQGLFHHYILTDHNFLNVHTIAHLSLNYNNLNGELPSEIGFLTQLTGLFLQGNVLSGQIPSTLGTLSKLGRYIKTY